jgi:hypothetical protein
MIYGGFHFVLSYSHVFTLIGTLLLFRWAMYGRLAGRRRILAEVAFVWAMALTYFLVRGMVDDQVELAHANARDLVRLERHLHMFHEPWLQRQALQHDLLMRFANHVYVWWHWPLIVVVLVWLYVKHPAHYPIYRNAFLISGAIGIAMFFIYPVAPPRLLVDFDFTDTVNKRAIFNNILLPPSLTNLYAAMPSLHAGWNLIIGVAIVRHARHPLARGFGVVMPVLMWWAIVVTGNHYIIDGLVGDALAEVGIVVALARAHRVTTSPPELAPVTT